MEEIYLHELRGFVDAEGRLKQLPGKYRKKVIAVYWLAERIPADAVYTEREFNDLLKTQHTFGDPATLRRELVDARLVNRAPGGTAYTLNPDRPALAETLEAIK